MASGPPAQYFQGPKRLWQLIFLQVLSFILLASIFFPLSGQCVIPIAGYSSSRCCAIKTVLLELLLIFILDKTVPQTKFWKTTPLDQLDEGQWESLCDGCGKCCVLKLEDADTGVVHYTDVSCKLLDCQTARCNKYSERKKHVPDCVLLSPNNLSMLSWMPWPTSCRSADCPLSDARPPRVGCTAP